MKVDELKLMRVIIYFSISMFTICVLLDYSLLANIAKAFIFPVYLYAYLRRSSQKNKYFIFFLLGFSLTGIHAVINQLDSGIYSCIGSIPIVMAYFFLLIFLMERLRIKHLIRHFGGYLAILAIFNVYVVFTLNQMMIEDEYLQDTSWEFVFECVYNLFVVLVLSLSLLNYLYDDTKKNLLLFLAIACIAFSEMVQIVYIFSDAKILKIPYSLLLVTGIYFIYTYIESKQIG